MNFLKKLFQSSGSTGNPAVMFYVRPKHCDRIVEVRIDLYNDLSLTDDGGYFVRKIARAARCPFPAELHLYFDKNRKLVNSEAIDGEQVAEEEYKAWLAEQEAKTGK